MFLSRRAAALSTVLLIKISAERVRIPNRVLALAFLNEACGINVASVMTPCATVPLFGKTNLVTVGLSCHQPLMRAGFQPTVLFWGIFSERGFLNGQPNHFFHKFKGEHLAPFASVCSCHLCVCLVVRVP